jgi:hypothetical protein
LRTEAKISDQSLNEFLAALAQARITGEHRPYAIRYARRSAAPG